MLLDILENASPLISKINCYDRQVIENKTPNNYFVFTYRKTVFITP